MKDTEFFELLNLYLDHEISAADAARLEAEVQNNPERRQIYRQYCRMQKACQMLGAEFETDTDGATPFSGRKVISFNPAVIAAAERRRRRRLRLGVGGGFAALAASLAVLVGGRSEKSSSETPAASAPVAVAPAAPVADPATISDPASTFVPEKSASPRGLVSLAPRPQPRVDRDPLLLTSQMQSGAVLTSSVGSNEDQLAWIHSVQLSPLQVRTPADLNFTATFGSEPRTLGNRQASPMKVSQPAADEYLGFQFRK